VIRSTESKASEYCEEIEIEKPKPQRSSGDIVEVYSPEKEEDKITFETVGSSKSSIKRASYFALPVSKLRPVSSVSSFDDDDEDEDVFEPSPREHNSQSSPIYDTESQQAFEIDSDHDSFFGDTIKLDHFNQSKPISPVIRMPSLGPASLTQVYVPEEAPAKVEHNLEPIPRTYVAAKIARINSKSQKKNNSPIVLRKPSMNQKTKRPYNHTEKRQTTLRLSLDEFRRLNVTFHQENGIVYMNTNTLSNVQINVINGIKVSKMPVTFLRQLVNNFPRRGVKNVELIYS